jgi:hypothetical protein
MDVDVIDRWLSTIQIIVVCDQLLKLNEDTITMFASYIYSYICSIFYFPILQNGKNPTIQIFAN